MAGSIAQWGPLPKILPFVIHIAISAPLLLLLPKVPDTNTDTAGTAFRSSVAVRSARHRRFVRIVAVCAPWLFVACGLSYGYQPILLASASGSLGLAYATLLSVIALVSSALIQPVAKRIDSHSSARGILTSMVLILAGLGVMILAVTTFNLIIGALSSIVFGCGFGIGLVSGLLEAQRIARANEQAKLTGVFYAVAYIGFASPTLLASLTSIATPVELLWGVAVVLVCCGAVIAYGSRKHLPI